MRLCQAKSQPPNAITRELLGSLTIVFCPLLCVAEIQRLLAVYAHLIPRVTCPPSLVRARVFCPLFCHWPRVKTTRTPCLSRPSGRVTSETRACIFPALLFCCRNETPLAVYRMTSFAPISLSNAGSQI